MYLYFNSKGVLEEVVNDIPTRKDSSNVNHIYVYIDGVAYNTDDKYYPLPDSIESLSTRYQLPDGTITPVALVQGKVQQSIPYDKHRDMKCFKDFYNYEFFDIELPSGVNEDGSQSEMPNVLGQSGLVALTIIEQPVGLALGLVVFTVEQEVGITTDTLITEAQFNYLMGYVAKYDKQVSDIKTLIPDGTTENNKLTNTTIVQNMIDTNIPTFTTSTIWTQEFIDKVRNVGYALYHPTANTSRLYSVCSDLPEKDITLMNIVHTRLSIVISRFGASLNGTLDLSETQTLVVYSKDGRIERVATPINNSDAANKTYVDTNISEVNDTIENVNTYAQNTQQELNELKESLYGYVFGEDTANFSKLDISALPSMINNNNVAYNTRLMLDTIKGRSVKWTQLINPEHFSISQTINGMTFTVDKTKGTITCNGTTTAAVSLYVANETSKVFQATPNDIICLKGCPSGGSASTYYLAFYGTTYNDFGSGVYDKLSNRRANTTDTINTSMAIAIEIASGVTMTNKVFRPQLFNVSNIYGLGKEPKTMADFNKDYPYSIYPYGKQEILTTKVSGIKIRAGYKNLLDKTKFVATQTINGVVITNNNDGTFTCNGTADADITRPIIINSEYQNTSINYNTYLLLKGCPSGGSESTYSLMLVTYGQKDYGQGVIMMTTPDGTFVGTIQANAFIVIKQGTTCNNLVFKPQLINLTNTYGAGNEPTTVAQFNQDFPDIDNIPYPEQTISFAEQTLYGINDVQDTLQVVKENDGYKLQKVENIGNVDLGTLDYAKSTDESLKYFRTALPDAQAISEHTIPNILCSKYITDTKNNVWGNFTYNLTIGEGANATTQDTELDIRDDTAWKNNTTEEFKTSLNGQILYYAKRTPTTTTLATLTKNQVTALFAKGYCVEILGNDDNKIIVRPDLSLNMVIKLIGGNTNE